MGDLRWVGLVSGLLFVGVLGGLMAPLPSEAVVPATTSVTLQVDGGTPISILSPTNTSSTCTTAEGTGTGGLGYTACYAIRTDGLAVATGTNGRQFKVLNAPNATARLRVADKVGQDKFSLIGVQFVPVATNWGNVGTTTPAFANTNES